MDADASSDEATRLNLTTLQSLFDDEVDVIREILETYVEDLHNNSRELRAARAAEDRKRFGRVAHSMKGASANVGADAFASMCADLERHSAASPWGALDEMSDRLTATAAALADNVRKQIQDIVTT